MNAPLAQFAPFPEILKDLVDKATYRHGWTFRLDDVQRDKDHGRGSAGGLTLIIETATANSYDPRTCDLCDSPVTYYHVSHYFIVPAATYDQRSWRRWLFERVRDVESHEACEFFQIAGERPFAPSHGPGNDPYLIRELGTDEDQRTSFRGDLND
jgi:hypothetical protein